MAFMGAYFYIQIFPRGDMELMKMGFTEHFSILSSTEIKWFFGLSWTVWYLGLTGIIWISRFKWNFGTSD